MLIVQNEHCCQLMGYGNRLERYPPVSIPVHIDPREIHNNPVTSTRRHRKQAIEMHPVGNRPPEPNRSASSRLSISASKFPVQVVQRRLRGDHSPGFWLYYLALLLIIPAIPAPPKGLYRSFSLYVAYSRRGHVENGPGTSFKEDQGRWQRGGHEQPISVSR